MFLRACLCYLCNVSAALWLKPSFRSTTLASLHRQVVLGPGSAPFCRPRLGVRFLLPLAGRLHTGTQLACLCATLLCRCDPFVSIQDEFREWRQSVMFPPREDRCDRRRLYLNRIAVRMRQSSRLCTCTREWTVTMPCGVTSWTRQKKRQWRTASKGSEVGQILTAHMQVVGGVELQSDERGPHCGAGVICAGGLPRASATSPST